MLKILFLSKTNWLAGYLNEITFVNDEDIIIQKINDRELDVNIIIEDIELAKKANFKLIHAINNDEIFENIPTVLISNNILTEIESINIYNYDDLIVPPFNKTLLLKKITTIIKSKSSFMFDGIEPILKNLPANIYIKDKRGKYVFMSNIWPEMYKTENIKGKFDSAIRIDGNTNITTEVDSDANILRHDIGDHYTIKVKHKFGTKYIDVLKQPIHNKIGEITGIIGLMNDVTETNHLNRKLAKLAKMDSLTQIYNKATTQHFIKQQMRLDVQKNILSALCIIDIDDFKSINDTYGHMVGDKILQELSEILKKHVRETDIIGRIGGDEFMIYFHNVKEQTVVSEMLCRIITEIDSTLSMKYNNKISISIGAALVPIHGKSFADLYSLSDEMLYSIKKSGKNDFKIFEG